MKAQPGGLEVDREARPHGTLQVEHLDVLPALLQECDEEVHCKLHVDADGLVVLNGLTGNSGCNAQVAVTLVEINFDLVPQLHRHFLEVLAGGLA